ncbi:hypothetical protein PJF56_11375 [Roseofilum sp. BLCC_M91]|uniref:Glycosyltransferase RgtA/B/C/D-like domain-containing protein n=1 Tax=Roseofilum halophilum BLCC-M91 TaxID=3022259 RepID=A0ABT7BLP6_9CYAN|nr:hypothetical protein [Roseofilum halophilum]MDJ1179464.1 hypothetical protein [Roseofilum halophilum BLCC-M91]
MKTQMTQNSNQNKLEILEAIAVIVILAIIHLFLWWKYLPIAHIDLNFYTEPALMLARHGILSGPGSQHLDITYAKGIYFYPPGYALIVAGWIKLFGFSIRSLLAYTNLIHMLYLCALWILMRKRFNCTKLATSLVLISAFPMFNHGRPDVTALFISTLAWIIVPHQFKLPRMIYSAILMGLAILVSLPFGISSAATVITFYLVSPHLRLSQRFKGVIILISIMTLTILSIWGFVFTWQNAWIFGPEQFMVNLANRGQNLNQIVLPPLLYSLAFIIVPLGFMILIPLGFTLYWYRCSLSSPLVQVSLSYLTGFTTWFFLSKGPLMMMYHFSFIARPVFQGVLASFRKPIRFIAIGLLVAFTMINFYYEKDEFLLLASDSSEAYSMLESILVDIQPDKIAAIDSHLFPILYREGKTINYEIFHTNSWKSYYDATSPKTLDLLFKNEAMPLKPLIPDIIVVSEITLYFGDTSSLSGFRNVTDEEVVIPELSLLGHTIKFPQNPLRAYIFERIVEEE